MLPSGPRIRTASIKKKGRAPTINQRTKPKRSKSHPKPPAKTRAHGKRKNIKKHSEPCLQRTFEQVRHGNPPGLIQKRSRFNKEKQATDKCPLTLSLRVASTLEHQIWEVKPTFYHRHRAQQTKEYSKGVLPPRPSSSSRMRAAQGRAHETSTSTS